MDNPAYNELSITLAKFFLKFAGAWFARSRADEVRRTISLLQVAVITVYCIWVNIMSIDYFWHSDMSYCAYCFTNLLLVVMAASKVTILRIHKLDLEIVVAYMERHFWHYNYDPEEQVIFAECQKYCKLFSYFVLCIPGFVLFSYCSSPIISNIGSNKSERELLSRLDFTDFPTTETPYYELLFVVQVFVVIVMFFAYICTDVFLCITNIHVICQFRILRHRMMRFWNSDVEDMDIVRYSAQCYAAMKKCVQQHQSLIEFCEKLEHLFKFAIFLHITVFSVLMGLDCYQIIFANIPMSKRLVFVFHMMGSFIHLVIFAYSCHGLTEESMNIVTTVYLGSWTTLPMNKFGRSLRSDIRMIMIRSLKPCCLTAGGFFPVTLETVTTLTSSTFSYFTLIRESFLRNENK